MTDFNNSPNIAPVRIGNVTVQLAKHHVIATETFNESSFLQALQENGLWDQNDFKTNGLALTNKITTADGLR